jgi:hypothetical protein
MRTDGREDRRTDMNMTKLTVAFRNYANASTKTNCNNITNSFHLDVIEPDYLKGFS